VNQAKVGGGTRVKILDQIRSAYLDRRFRTENTTSAYWDIRKRELSYLESFFDNVNEKTSISYTMAKLFSAMKVLAEDTVEGAPRKDLQASGIDFVQQLNSIYTGLLALQDTQNKAIEVTVEDINIIAEEIVSLNKAIYGFELTGHVANDLRDKRNVLLDELSTIVDIEYKEYTDKWGATAMRVWINDGSEPPPPGRYLVDHDLRYSLGVKEETNAIPGEPAVFVPYWNDFFRDGVPDDDPPHDVGLDEILNMSEIRFGELKALMDMRDNDGIDMSGIPYYIEQLNNLARALVQEINIVHRQGWTDPPFGASVNGVNFFYEDNSWISWEGTIGTPSAGISLVWNEEESVWVDKDNPLNTLSWYATAAAAEADGFARILDTSQITIKNIRLSDEVMASEFNIAASTKQIVREGLPDQQQRGNNENMNALYALYGKTTISLLHLGSTDPVSIGSFDGYATSIRVDVARKLKTAIDMGDTSSTLMLAAELQRTSVSGVSLDEEMTNLIRYNHAYNGASRVITAMDDLLDRLINGTGRVGL